MYCEIGKFLYLNMIESMVALLFGNMVLSIIFIETLMTL